MKLTLIIMSFVFVMWQGYGYVVNKDKWPKIIREIEYPSSADGTLQPAFFFNPDIDYPAPLLVALHTWSGDYRQKEGIPYAKWCIDNKWAFIHPNFRGPNNHPDATGSDLVIQDIIDAVNYAEKNANVDKSRIYLIGYSGGGYAALLVAARHPEIWAGISVWCPITDLMAWYRECKNSNSKYMFDIVKSCGGVPGESMIVDEEYKKRSPSTYLSPSFDIPIDINAGIEDGHTGSVPISHSLKAYNQIADMGDQISENDILQITNEKKIPLAFQNNIDDIEFYERRILLRKVSKKACLTIFNGGHEILYNSALHWLSRQSQDENSIVEQTQ